MLIDLKKKRSYFEEMPIPELERLRLQVVWYNANTEEVTSFGLYKVNGIEITKATESKNVVIVSAANHPNATFTIGDTAKKLWNDALKADANNVDNDNYLMCYHEHKSDNIIVETALILAK